MQTTQEAQQQLRKLVRQVQEDSQRAFDERRATREQADQEGAARVKIAYDQFRAMGLDPDVLSQELNGDHSEARERLSRKLSDASPAKSTELAMPMEDELLAAQPPPDVHVLSPVFASVNIAKSSAPEREQAPVSATYVYNYTEHNPWCWAQGAGSGLFGTGVGETSIEVDFWYYFVPPTYRFYSIIPYTTYRGYYIVQSDDHWYDSHEAKAKLNNFVNVYQYNWKGWDDNLLLDVEGDNINVNSRFDDTRSHYYSSLLAANDGVWILNRVRLYVYARGGSAYSKLDFGTGDGNWIRAPYVYVA
jgi:hypothetical protein